MTSWEREQEEYRLSKRDSEEMAAICIAGVIILTFCALGFEAWQRFIAPLFS